MNEVTADPLEPALTTPPANPHILWRQILGLVVWVTVITWLAGGLTSVVFGLLLGGATFADAWTSGIFKKPNSKAFLNISPMTWGIVMVGLFIVTYPLYLFKRNSLRTRNAGNGYFIAVIVLGVIVIIGLTLQLMGIVPPR